MKLQSINKRILLIIVILASVGLVIHLAPISKEVHIDKETITYETHDILTSTSTYTSEISTSHIQSKTTIIDSIGDSSNPSRGDLVYIILEKDENSLYLTMKLSEGKFASRCTPIITLIKNPTLYYSVSLDTRSRCYLTKLSNDDIVSKKKIQNSEVNKDLWKVTLPLSEIDYLTEFTVSAGIFSSKGDEIDIIPYSLEKLNLDYVYDTIKVDLTSTSTVTSFMWVTSTSSSIYHVDAPLKERTIITPILFIGALALLLGVILDATTKPIKTDEKSETAKITRKIFEAEKTQLISIKMKHCPFCGAKIPEVAIYCEECGRKIESAKSTVIKSNSFGIKVWLLIAAMIVATIIPILGFVINIFILLGLAYVVYSDAKSRGERDASGWAIFTFFLLLIALPWYYSSVVTKKSIIHKFEDSFVVRRCPFCREDLTSTRYDTQYCMHCGNRLVASQKNCIYCDSRAFIYMNGIFCSNCGTIQPETS